MSEHRRSHRLLLLAAIPLALLLLWPLPRVLGTAMIGAPEGELARHLWGWFAALREGAALRFHTDLRGWPQGVDHFLIDPLHLLPYAIGSAIGGPALGWNLVLLVGVLVGGLAGWLLAEESPLSGRLLGLCAGLAIPTVLAVGVDGITEGLGVGWVGVQLALLLRLGRQPSRRGALLLGLAIAAATWSGIYNAVWVAMIDLPVGIWLLRRTRLPVLGGGIGLILSAPYLLAAWSQDPSLSGGSGHVIDLGPMNLQLGWRASHRDGADLLDLFLPAPLAPSQALLPHTAYLGAALLLLGLVGFARAPRARWGWALGVILFAALALGPTLRVHGDPLTLFGAHLSGPAAWLRAATPLSRITRWYRAGAVATLLLVPLASRAIGGGWCLLAAALVLVDGRLGAPLPMPFPTTALPGGIEEIDGVVIEVPSDQARPTRGQISDLGVLVQVFHGQPAVDDLTMRPASNPKLTRWLARLENPRARRDPVGKAELEEARAALSKAGVAWLLVFPGRTSWDVKETPYPEAFGAPDLQGPSWVGWRLDGSASGHLR